MPTRSACKGRLQVGSVFGFVAGMIALMFAALWTGMSHRSSMPLVTPLRIHGLCVPVYCLSGASIGGLWPLRRHRVGRWLLWPMATATGAITVAALAFGAPWLWSHRQIGAYTLMAVLSTPVLATSTPSPPEGR